MERCALVNTPEKWLQSRRNDRTRSTVLINLGSVKCDLIVLHPTQLHNALLMMMCVSLCSVWLSLQFAQLPFAHKQGTSHHPHALESLPGDALLHQLLL